MFGLVVIIRIFYWNYSYLLTIILWRYKTRSVKINKKFIWIKINYGVRIRVARFGAVSLDIREDSNFSIIEESVSDASVRPFLNFDPPTLLRPKLYFELYFSTNKKSRFDKRSKYRGRSRAGEVQKRSKIWKWSKYQKGGTTLYFCYFHIFDLLFTSIGLLRLAYFELFGTLYFDLFADLDSRSTGRSKVSPKT